MVEQSALQDVQHVKAVADAVMKARAYNATSTSIGLAVIAITVAGNDPMAKTALAFAMLRMIKNDLDPDVLDAKWN